MTQQESKTKPLKEEPSVMRRVGLVVLLAMGSYALTLCILSDTVFFLGLPGLVGITVLTFLAVQWFIYRSVEGDRVRHAAEALDVKGVIKEHYRASVVRALSIVLASGVLVVLAAVLDSPFLYPLMGVGLLGILLAVGFSSRQVSKISSCSRAFKAYPLEFRGSVDPINLRSDGRRVLRLGNSGAKDSVVMSAREPMRSRKWPKDIADGVWFAGDDDFGGAFLVPGTGELMCMQPKNWDEHATAREAADKERQARARKAGLTRHHL